MRASRREILLSAAFAFWGFTIAITLIHLWDRPAPPDQMMGMARLHDFEAHGPFRWMAGLMLLPVLLPLAMRPAIRRLANGEAWARNTVLIAPLVTMWLVTIETNRGTAIVPCAMVILLCVLFCRRELRFTRNDVVLLPVFLTMLMGIIDVAPKIPVNHCVPIAALLLFIVRIAVGLIPSPVPPGLAFVVAPLGLILQTGFFARDERYFGWHALAIAVVSPFLVRLFLRNERTLRRALIFFIYPLSLYAYTNAMNMTTAEGKPRINFFESGHSLMPASEYLRGERPYRDVLPAHGLFEDGFFDYLVFLTGDVNAGRSAKAREVVGGLTSIFLYVLAFAATGSAEGGLLAVFLAVMTGTYAPTIRMLPPIAVLALIAYAIRWRRPRFFAYAAFATVIAGLTSLDFGAYSFLSLVIAVLRTRPAERREVLRWTGIGLATGVVPLFLAFAVLGILDDFFRGTFIEVLRVGPAYTQTFFTPHPLMAQRRWFPEILSFSLDQVVFQYLFWPLAAIFAGVTVTRRWPRRFEPMVLLGVWIVLTGISYSERHHLYFGMAAMVMTTALIVMLLRRRSALAIPTIVLAFVLIAPATHLSVVGWMRRSRGPIEPNWVEVRDIPRARGAYWHTSDVAVMQSVKKYLSLTMQPGDTFLDFSNSPLVYFLFNRDCPVREYETAFMEREDTQREIIRRIESNPRIRAVMVARTPQGRYSVDGVPNSWRAPILHQYIGEHFEPDFEEGEVAFWRRR